MASSLLSSIQNQRCDVFVSFEKSDTGKTFVSHLCRSLNRKGIATFKLPSGQPIEMLGAIGDSKIALVVMSENYASSVWCMAQLTEIIKFMEEGTLSVIPIFYEVDPSDLQSAAEVTRELWGRALTLLASLPGENTDYWDDDAELVDKVTDDICEKLTTSTSSGYSNLFGMDCHMKALYEMLDLGSNVQKVVGISGVSGVGKTTIARYAYEEISHNFHTHVFIEGCSPSRLQEEFLSKLVIQNEALAIKNSKDESEAAKSRLRHRKVLFIADGVDKIEQLEDVWEVASWLCQGSRVIVTTQYCGLFVAKGLRNVYEVKRLRYDEALQFFYQFAFMGQPPYNHFKQLSVRATKLAGCLPLSLKILGSFLNGKGEKDWESALQSLEAEQDKDAVLATIRKAPAESRISKPNPPAKVNQFIGSGSEPLFEMHGSYSAKLVDYMKMASDIISSDAPDDSDVAPSPDGSRFDPSPDVDAKADDFIARFQHQLKLQRIDSLKRYKSMVDNSKREKEISFDKESQK